MIALFALSSVSFADSAFNASEVATDFPEISALSFVVADTRTGEILFSHNENARLPIASTTKILTCLTVLENARLDDIVTVSAGACGVEGSSVYLYEGEKISVKDLLYALMLESANDAAVCLAEYVSGGVDEFATLMNERAKSLSLSNSHFNNPHGLEDAEHYSTAFDLAKLWCEAMKNDVFREIVSTKSYRIDLPETDEYRFLSNHNKLLKTNEYCIGGKTGFTKNAGRCLVTGAEHNGAELVVVTLNDPNDWSDHEALFEKAFSLYSTVDVARAGDVSHNVRVVGGNVGEMRLTNRDSLSLTLRDVTALESHIESPRFVYAPIDDLSSSLGSVVYTVNGAEVARLPLYPEKAVEKPVKKSFFKKIFDFIF